MVRVDVFDLEWRQLLRQLGTHQRVASAECEASEKRRLHSKAARSAKALPIGASRRAARISSRPRAAGNTRLFPKRALRQAEISRRDAFAAAADHLRSAAA